mgnify:CR=1 FL=1
MRRDTILHTPKKEKRVKSIEFLGGNWVMLLSVATMLTWLVLAVFVALRLSIRCCSVTVIAGASLISRSLNITVTSSIQGVLLRIVPQIGYNFTRKELYVKADTEFQYWPEKQAGFEINVGNGNRIYSSVVLDQLKQLPDSTFNFDKVELDYLKIVYL